MTDHTPEQQDSVNPEWQDAVGEAAEPLWQALACEPAPVMKPSLFVGENPYPHSRPVANHSRRVAWIWPVALAASLMLSLGLGWELRQQQGDNRNLQLENWLLQSQSPEPLRRLQALERLRNASGQIQSEHWPALLLSFQSARDPNTQLAALEILISVGAVQSIADLPDTVQTSTFPLIEASFQRQQP